MRGRRGSERLVVAVAGAAVALAVSGGSVARPAGADTIQTVVGTGVAGFDGIGGQAREAALTQPRGLFPWQGAGIVWAEPLTHTVRAVGPDGIVKLIAGTPGRPGPSGDGGAAVEAKLDRPSASVATPDGGVLIADTGTSNIRFVDRRGVISTVAGVGSAGYSGNGGPATSARLRLPTGVARLAGGGFLIADAGNHAIRRVTPDGKISTVAGTGVGGYSGDGGKATGARLSFPTSVAPTADGGFLVVDSVNQRVRKIGPDGTIGTVAGNGTRGYGGDGGPATSAALADPRSVAVLSDGSFFIADTGNHRIRRVAPDGTISTFAGTGRAGLSGDGRAAGSAWLASPEGVAVTATGGVLIADSANNRIRLVGVAIPPKNVEPPAIAGDSAEGSTLTAWAGGWRGTGPAIAYRWQRCDQIRTRCVNVPGATGKTYRVRGSDFGSTLRLRVTARNEAGAAIAFSTRIGVGRLVRETFFVHGTGRDDGAVRGVVEAGSAPRVSVDLAGKSVGVTRRRLGGSRWESSVGVLRYDTSPLGDGLRLESAQLVLWVLSARSGDRARLVVHFCPGIGAIDSEDFRAFALPGGTARIPISRIRRGPAAVGLSDPGAIALAGMTELCLYVSGRVPRGANAVTFGSRELAKEQSAFLVVTYRARGHAS